MVKSGHKKEAGSFPASDLLQRTEDPSDMAERVAARVSAHEIFNCLKDETVVEIIYLYYWEGYSQKEIAEMLGLSAANVRKKHSRAIRSLKEMYDDASHNDDERHS